MANPFEQVPVITDVADNIPGGMRKAIFDLNGLYDYGTKDFKLSDYQWYPDYGSTGTMETILNSISLPGVGQLLDITQKQNKLLELESQRLEREERTIIIAPKPTLYETNNLTPRLAY